MLSGDILESWAACFNFFVNRGGCQETSLIYGKIGDHAICE